MFVFVVLFSLRLIFEPRYVRQCIFTTDVLDGPPKCRKELHLLAALAEHVLPLCVQ